MLVLHTSALTDFPKISTVFVKFCVHQPWLHRPAWSAWAAEASCTRTSPSSSSRQDPSPSVSLSTPWSTCKETGGELMLLQHHDSSTGQFLISFRPTSFSCIYCFLIWDFCFDSFHSQMLSLFRPQGQADSKRLGTMLGTTFYLPSLVKMSREQAGEQQLYDEVIFTDI